MSLRIRGQEATVRVTVDGQVQDGSWFKVKNFTLTPRGDLTEEDYLGELESDLDHQHHGFDLSFEVDLQDRKVIDYMKTIIDREQNQAAHPNVTINVIFAFRGDNGQPMAISLYGVFLRPTEIGIGGRKEYVSAPFEGKAKKWGLLDL